MFRVSLRVFVEAGLFRRRQIIITIVVSIAAVVPITYLAFRPWILDPRYRSLSAAADQGDPGYQRLLADYLYEKRDFKHALQWQQKSAEAGDPHAQFYMGNYFRKGFEHLKPSHHDYRKALEWYHKSAVQDFQPSQAELCEMYAKGDGTSPNPEESYFWCSIAEVSRQTLKFKQMSGNALDHKSLRDVENRVTAWVESHRKVRQSLPNASLVSLKPFLPKPATLSAGRNSEPIVMHTHPNPLQLAERALEA
jgi:hypothetical protein